MQNFSSLTFFALLLGLVLKSVTSAAPPFYIIHCKMGYGNLLSFMYSSLLVHREATVFHTISRNRPCLRFKGHMSFLCDWINIIENYFDMFK